MESSGLITAALTADQWRRIVWLARTTLNREMLAYTLGGHHILCMADFVDACNALAKALPYDVALGFGIAKPVPAQPNNDDVVPGNDDVVGGDEYG